jgi:diadenosine tetraphosphate (Ap4A) HIT family hydrolase
MEAAKLLLNTERVRRLEQLLGGDPVTEGHVLVFIKNKFGARNLAEIPEKTAKEIFRRPADFLVAAKKFCVPELPF